jgi:SAM-dependent MidA family methyltransferase
VQDVTLVRGDAWQRLERAGLPDGLVEVASELPRSPSIEGVILSNELLDALPFHRVRLRGGVLYELRVGLQDGRFVDVETAPLPVIEHYFRGLGVAPAEGCEAEVNLAAPAWTRRAANALRRGYLLTLDYGYEAEQLYAPWRTRGTLLTFYRHTSGDDPYARIGRQDVTASVDFTSVVRAGEAAGLKTMALLTQADYLASLGIGEALAARPSGGEIEVYYALRRAVIELTDTSGLGRIRVLIQQK